jgi:pyruvate-formate lyase
VREIMCLSTQVPASLMPIEGGDWFAGRIDRQLVGVDPERGDLVDAAYYCRFSALEQRLADPATTEEQRRDLTGLIDYWRERTTHHRCRAAFPPHLQQGLPSDDYYRCEEISFPMYGLGGPCLDYRKLVTRGISGLRAEVRERVGDSVFGWSLLQALDIFSRSAYAYARQAEALLPAALHPSVHQRLKLVAASLTHVSEQPPRTYHEAIQLVWLYSIVALPRNYGRLDVTLGDFLARDLDSGAITEKEAFDMTSGLWRLIAARGDNFNNRIIVGGRGRPEPETADRFARLALEVQKSTCGPIPQLTLRWHAGMDSALWQAAFDCFAAGSTFPILYNDDVNVPAVAQALGVSEDEALQYVPYGCGEYVLDHASVGSPDAALNVLKALDVTLRGGVDGYTGRTMGLNLGRLSGFTTFADLQNAMTEQVEHEVALLAEVQAAIYRVTAEEVAFPFLSLLYDDCIARGKPLLKGGARYLGGTLESFGNNTAADALLAIREAVFERKLLSAERLLACLDADFVGCERERQLLRTSPKYGNDHPDADAMSVWLNRMVCEATARQTARVGLDSFRVVLVNNGDSVLFGRTTAASADGRRKGEPVSNGNQPSAGNDTRGLTALLNSMARLPPGLHAGATHNVKLSRRTLTAGRAAVESLLGGYFVSGGTQAMITVADRGELEDALVHPEKHGDLVVRVGGYSERFVHLPRDVQLEVARRTLY